MSPRNKVYLLVEPAGDGSCSSIFKHTSVFVEFEDGLKYEFSYNENGVRYSAFDEMPSDRDEIIYKGETDKTLLQIIEETQKMVETKFKEYETLYHNCNHFSDALLQFLCKEKIPTSLRQSSNYMTGAYVGALAVGTVLGGPIGLVAAHVFSSPVLLMYPKYKAKK
ncbi:deubiquitinase DESI2-like [Culicoides brevitarsis]|uniref:deubiquitinase DESI2-like n=1 Tax=Culicoides brevitarsis TaxID=469753 RepID=UPI00307C47B2